MRKTILLFVLAGLSLLSRAQVGINGSGGNPHGSAMLDVNSSDKGFLPPRMSWTQIRAIQNPAAGLLVYDEGIKAIRMFNGSAWVVLAAKEYELSDPPGNFSTIVPAASTGSTDGQRLAVGPAGEVYVVGFLNQSITFGNDTVSGSFSSLVAAFDSVGNYRWGRALGSLAQLSVFDIKVESSGDLLLCGDFNGTVDFDLGPGTNQQTSSSNTAFLVRYDRDGNLMAVKTFPSSSNSSALALTNDAAGNVYLTGYFGGTMDSDPGAGTQNLTAAGTDIFLIGLDNALNWSWSKAMGGSSVERPDKLIVVGGTLVISGTFFGTADFDPSAATANLTAVGGEDIFLCNYTTAGNLLWARVIAGTNAHSATALIAPGNSGEIWLASSFNGSIDADPGGATFTLTSTNSFFDFFVARYNSSGSLVAGSAFKVGGTGSEGARGISADGAGNVFLTGYFESGDFDPGVANVPLPTHGASNAFLVKYSAGGAMLFGKSMGGNNSVLGYDVDVKANGRIGYITGSAAAPFKAFNGEKFTSNGFFLSRYEE